MHISLMFNLKLQTKGIFFSSSTCLLNFILYRYFTSVVYSITLSFFHTPTPFTKLFVLFFLLFKKQYITEIIRNKNGSKCLAKVSNYKN